ncbi:ankyrin repeat domain-containing protein [bacterium]|nr:ankyrin repeat domain-containing protein [bacterium]
MLQRDAIKLTPLQDSQRGARRARQMAAQRTHCWPARPNVYLDTVLTASNPEFPLFAANEVPLLCYCPDISASSEDFYLAGGYAEIVLGEGEASAAKHIGTPRLSEATRKANCAPEGRVIDAARKLAKYYTEHHVCSSSCRVFHAPSRIDCFHTHQVVAADEDSESTETFESSASCDHFLVKVIMGVDLQSSDSQLMTDQTHSSDWYLHGINLGEVVAKPLGVYTKTLTESDLKNLTYTRVGVVYDAEAGLETPCVYGGQGVHGDRHKHPDCTMPVWVAGALTIFPISSGVELHHRQHMAKMPTSISPTGARVHGCRFVPRDKLNDFFALVGGVASVAVDGGTSSGHSTQVVEAIGYELANMMKGDEAAMIMTSQCLRGHPSAVSFEASVTRGWCSGGGRAAHFVGAESVTLFGEAFHLPHGTTYLLQPTHEDEDKVRKRHMRTSTAAPSNSSCTYVAEAALHASTVKEGSLFLLGDSEESVGAKAWRVAALMEKDHVFSIADTCSASRTSGLVHSKSSFDSDTILAAIKNVTIVLPRLDMQYQKQVKAAYDDEADVERGPQSDDSESECIRMVLHRNGINLLGPNLAGDFFLVANSETTREDRGDCVTPSTYEYSAGGIGAFYCFARHPYSIRNSRLMPKSSAHVQTYAQRCAVLMYVESQKRFPECDRRFSKLKRPSLLSSDREDSQGATWGRSLLHELAERGTQGPLATEIVGLSHEERAMPCFDADDEREESPLVQSSDRGGSVSDVQRHPLLCKDYDGNTAAHLAVRFNHSQCLKLLLRAGCTKLQLVAQCQNGNEHIAHVAAKFGHVEVFKVIFEVSRDMALAGDVLVPSERCNVQDPMIPDDMKTLLLTPNRAGSSTLHILVENESHECARFLLHAVRRLRGGEGILRTMLLQFSGNGFLPVHLAAKYRNIRALKILLGEDFEIAGQLTEYSREKAYGGTVMHWAVKDEWCTGLDTHGSKRLACLEYILEVATHYTHQQARASSLATKPDESATPQSLVLMKSTTFGGLPLHEAARVGNTEAVKCLLNFLPQKQVVCQDRYGHTPLHHAAYYKHPRVVKTLLWTCRADEQVLAKNRYNRVPAHDAALYVPARVSHRKDTNGKQVELTPNKDCVEHLLCAGNAQRQLLARDELGKTPLELAIDARGHGNAGVESFMWHVLSTLRDSYCARREHEHDEQLKRRPATLAGVQTLVRKFRFCHQCGDSVRVKHSRARAILPDAKGRYSLQPVCVNCAQKLAMEEPGVPPVFNGLVASQLHYDVTRLICLHVTYAVVAQLRLCTFALHKRSSALTEDANETPMSGKVARRKSRHRSAFNLLFADEEHEKRTAERQEHQRSLLSQGCFWLLPNTRRGLHRLLDLFKSLDHQVNGSIEVSRCLGCVLILLVYMKLCVINRKNADPEDRMLVTEMLRTLVPNMRVGRKASTPPVEISHEKERTPVEDLLNQNFVLMNGIGELSGYSARLVAQRIIANEIVDMFDELPNRNIWRTLSERKIRDIYAEVRGPLEVLEALPDPHTGTDGIIGGHHLASTRKESFPKDKLILLQYETNRWNNFKHDTAIVCGWTLRKLRLYYVPAQLLLFTVVFYYDVRLTAHPSLAVTTACISLLSC